MTDCKINKRILFVATQEILLEKNDGGKKCSYRNWRLFVDLLGANNVTLMMMSNYKDWGEPNVIRLKAYHTIFERAINILCGRIFTSKRVEKAIISQLKKENYDYVFLDRALFGDIMSSIKNNFPNVKIMTFSHNVEENYFINKFKDKRIYQKFIIPKIRKSESETIKNTDYLFVLTKRDAQIYKEKYAKSANLLLNMTFNDLFERNRIEEVAYDNQILFIGSNFGPNYDGIKWFVNNVMDELEDYTLTIVGKGFENVKDELNRDNVKVIGSVENLEDYYYANNIMVMPIFYGDGQKVKTAEAMMYGKTIFATDEALEGYEVYDVEGIYRCNSKEDFINSIRKNISKSTKIYQESVRNLFIEKYRYEKSVELMEDFLKKI